MLQLPHGCRCSGSGPAVSPRNWDKLTRIKGPWRIHYRFYDTAGKSKAVKLMGMNDVHTLEERREITARLLSDELQALQNGYTPILKKTIPIACASMFSDGLRMIPAMRLALERTNISPVTKANIRHIIDVCERAAITLGLDILDIKDVRRKHIRAILEQCRVIQKKFSDNTFNHYRNHLLIVFRQIIKDEATENNPIKEIERLPVVRARRETLTDAQRQFVSSFLQTRHPSFHRFLLVFFDLGARISEMMRLRTSDIDLTGQRVRIHVLKGRAGRVTSRTISNVAIETWREILADAKPNDYIFSLGLLPGSEQIKSYQITKRWYRLIKMGKHPNGTAFGITADFYALKHLHTTEVVDHAGEHIAAKVNGHTSTAMVRQIYDTKGDARQHEEIKILPITFSKC